MTMTQFLFFKKKVYDFQHLSHLIKIFAIKSLGRFGDTKIPIHSAFFPQGSRKKGSHMGLI